MGWTGSASPGRRHPALRLCLGASLALYWNVDSVPSRKGALFQNKNPAIAPGGGSGAKSRRVLCEGKVLRARRTVSWSREFLRAVGFGCELDDVIDGPQLDGCGHRLRDPHFGTTVGSPPGEPGGGMTRVVPGSGSGARTAISGAMSAGGRITRRSCRASR